MIKELLFKLKFLNFTDLHVAEGRVPYYRDVVGNISKLNHPPISGEDIELIIEELAGKGSVKKIREEMVEIDTAYQLEGLGRCRVNSFLEMHGLSLALRMIPEDLPTIESIDLPEIAKELTPLPNGLILVTGATGSGKSTTLAALINHINQKQKRNILTIEDPIEFVHENQMSNVIQREVGRHTRSFENAIRAAMREDPDVIMMGELNNLETIKSALTLAETGHLVLATLHTNNAVQTVTRIIDVFPPEQQNQIKSQLSTSLRAVISQMLLSKKDGTGRVAAREVLLVNSAIESLIREGEVKQMHSIMQMGKEEGMKILTHSLIELISEGKITLESALEKFNNKQELLRYFEN